MKNIFIAGIICITLTACEVQSNKRLIEVCATSQHLDNYDKTISEAERDSNWKMRGIFLVLKKSFLTNTLEHNLRSNKKYELLYLECEFEQKSNSKKFKKRWG
tara:strand:- start:252 stop:560 length:309 start_codon:yes stop_codon:yes gene_type:complete